MVVALVETLVLVQAREILVLFVDFHLFFVEFCVDEFFFNLIFGYIQMCVIHVL